MRIRIALVPAALVAALGVVEVACGAPSDATAAPDAAAAPTRPDAGLPAEAGAAPDDAAAHDAGSSGGAGGLACARTQASPGGRDVCFATVSGVELGVLVPARPGARFTLGLYLHGDGARAHTGGSVFDGLADVAARRDVLVVSALAPNGCSWWQTPAHDCASSRTDRDRADENAAHLVEALEALRAAYDLANDVAYYGSSGGSIFLTSSFLPLHAGRFPGVAAVNCGGEAAAPERFAWEVTNAAARGSLSLRFTYGDADHLARDAHGAFVAYGALGVPVAEDVLPGVGHCAFDQHAVAARVWDAALAARGGGGAP